MSIIIIIIIIIITAICNNLPGAHIIFMNIFNLKNIVKLKKDNSVM